MQKLSYRIVSYRIVLTNFIILILFNSNIFAQDKGYVAFSIGANSPTGNFGSTDAKQFYSSTGLANPGPLLDISFAYKLGKNIGIAAIMRAQGNGINENALKTELQKSIPNNVSATYEAAGWGLGAYLTGLYGSFPISEKVSFESRALIGVVNARTPDIKTTLIGPSLIGTVRINSISAVSFAYLLGAGFKFDVGRKVCLLLNLDYLGADPEFKNGETNTIRNNVTLPTTFYSFTQNIGTINFSFGVGVRLGTGIKSVNQPVQQAQPTQQVQPIQQTQQDNYQPSYQDSRNQMTDVVYLKNGSIIKGLIIEQVPNVSIKIKLRDGNIMGFKIEEIEKITKEEVK